MAQIFTDAQNRLIWIAALVIYEVMLAHDDLDRVALASYTWDQLTSGGHEVFPPRLMEPAQEAATDRLAKIANRGRLGRPLCPELDY